MKIWTELEMQVLRDRYPVENTLFLANEFGVKPRVLRCKMHTIGVTKQAIPGKPVGGVNRLAKVWTAEEDDEIRRAWPDIARRVRGKNAAWLAQKLKVSCCCLRHRAAKLGLRVSRQKELPWSDDEIELLDRWLHLTPQRISVLLKRHGFNRTVGGIIVQRYRRFGGLAMATGGYSAHQVSELLGVSTSPVLRWIKKGWLKATPRGEVSPVNGSPTDRWNITPCTLKRFIMDHAALVGQRVNLVWLIDLLTNKD